MLAAAAVAFGVVFIAEIGDKSQLLVLSLASRYPRLQVLAGVAAAAAVMQAISVVAGSLVAEALPRRPVEIAAGLLFIAFGLLTLRSADDGEDADDTDGSARRRRSPVVVSAVAFGVAEFGDKTMLATAVLAASRDRLGTWAGSTAAMIASSVVAVLLGAALARRVDATVLRYAGAAVFALVGVLLLVGIG